MFGMTQEELEQQRVRTLSSRIPNNGTLRKIIEDAKPEMRSAVFEMIRPHLRFKPSRGIVEKYGAAAC